MIDDVITKGGNILVNALICMISANNNPIKINEKL